METIAKKGEWVKIVDFGNAFAPKELFTLNKPYQLLEDLNYKFGLDIINDMGSKDGFYYDTIIDRKIVIQKCEPTTETITIEVNAKDAPAIEMILRELELARLKHPIFPRIPQTQLSVLVEEVGEVAKDINDNKDYKQEVAQVATVCLRILTGE